MGEDTEAIAKALMDELGWFPSTDNERRAREVAAVLVAALPPNEDAAGWFGKFKGAEAALADANAEIERMKAACQHSSQTLEGEGLLRCELCGAVERDPFWRNPA